MNEFFRNWGVSLFAVGALRTFDLYYPPQPNIVSIAFCFVFGAGLFLITEVRKSR